MRIYLSVPMISNRQQARAMGMARAIKESGHEVASPWVLGPIEGQSPMSLNIFERDKRGAEESDAIVADVSQPSIGVGMELMAAHKAGKRVIVAMKRGSTVSRMLLHMEAKEVIEFEDDEDLYARLGALLRGGLGQRSPP